MSAKFPRGETGSFLAGSLIIAEPKYKHGQQEQVTVRNHNKADYEIMIRLK